MTHVRPDRRHRAARMSIWATILHFDEDEDFDATLRYLGSHVMPEDFHRPGPSLRFQLAAIPADVRDDAADPDRVLPWLRVSLGREDAVEALWDALGEWLDRQAPRKDEP